MKSIKFDQQTGTMLAQMTMIVRKDSQEESVFGGTNGFDDESVVLGVVKQAAAFTW